MLDELKITDARGKDEYRYVHTLSILILAENASYWSSPVQYASFRRHTPFYSWTMNE